MSAPVVVGRVDELAAVTRLLQPDGQLPAALVLRGDAGIGKTTLWLAGVEAARQRCRVLLARPSEAEAQFSFGTLTDLLGRHVGDVLPGLPPIQRRALETAMLLGDAEDRADDRAVAAAFLGALRLLAADAPVCIAIDDVQWIDAASLTAVRSAFARLDDEPVAVLLAVRGGVPEWLRRGPVQERVRTVELTGLGVGAVRRLISVRLGVTFPRPTLVRLTEASAGNPFVVLELAAAIQRRGGTVGPGEDLPVPPDVDQLVQARLDGLGPAALEVACAVAALAEPTVRLVESAVGPRTDSGLAETVAAGVLEVDGERLRFTHPLVRSAVVARQTPTRRRRLHARLADVVPSAEERARHLALATRDPDDDVAAVLEAAAQAVQARGAPAAAAELAEQALRLTTAPSRDAAFRRLLLAADLHRRAGDAARATDLLTAVLATAEPGDVRATVLTRLAEVHGPPAAIPLYEEALAEAADGTLRAQIHLRLATAMGWGEGVEGRVQHAELAVREASGTADPVLRCRALAVRGTAHFYAGHGISSEMDEAVALERTLPQWPIDDGPTHQLAAQRFWSADVAGGRELLDELLAVARARADPAAEADALWFLGFLAWRAGDWDEAERLAADSMELWLQFGRLTPPDELPAAVVAAHRGRVDDARARAQRAVASGAALGIHIAESGHSWVLGFLDLSLGNADAALVHLRRSYEIRATFMLEPAQHLELGDLLEALITVGELDEAQAVLDSWEPRSRAVDRAWALAILARCRGLLLAARGDLDGAFASFEQALTEHGRCRDPFHHARTVLALGRTRRRAKRRGAARAALEDACARFERLGAPLWAAQARSELARVGGRPPVGDQLTEAERRIATLVAEGRSNREVAAALFLTEHSVEAALTRVYRKLGVRSRAGLAHLMAPKA